MPKRVLYISPGTGLGGGEVSLLTLIANLDHTRYEPVVCVYGEGALAEHIRQIGCDLFIQTYHGPISQLSFMAKLTARICQSHADLVHVNTLDIRAGIATRLARRPLIGHLRVIFPSTWVDRLFVHLATKTISVSNAAQHDLCTKQNLSPNQFETIYNAVDTTHIPASTVTLRQELNIEPDTLLLGAIGRIDPWKGMEVFIDAAKNLHAKNANLHFVIAGAPGPSQEEQNYDKYLRHQVKELGLNPVFHFLGYRPDALNIIKQLNALIVPSRELQTPSGIKTEGFGRVAAEGLAMRTPVIASRIGGLPEIIQHGQTGFLFEPSNPVALTNAICHVLDHPENTRTIVEAGYAHFQNAFSVATHLQNIQNLYDRILTK